MSYMYDQITTARKRDTLEWEGELSPFLLSTRPETNLYHNHKVVVDSWNNIGYLTNHKANVKKGFYWIRDNLPDLIKPEFDLEHQICFAHDQSKTKQDEYDAYFYGGNRSFSVVQEFKKAWLLHIHRNPHHWQYWILINDDPEEGEVLIEMPYNYILEMICDWWAFSWSKGNLNEIFPWYEQRKNYIKLHPNSRKTLEHVLNQIKIKLKGENK